jgi:uncharacterized protein (DUF302 family)
MKRYLLICLLLCFQISWAENSIVTYISTNDYQTTKENIEIAIDGRGMLVSGILHISEMLNRTGPDLGIKNPVFKKAESVEFCSSEISHKMVQADPTNLTVCPFTVSVYVLSAQLDKVYVAYKRHQLAGNHAATEKLVNDLLDGIAVEAAE